MGYTLSHQWSTDKGNAYERHTLTLRNPMDSPGISCHQSEDDTGPARSEPRTQGTIGLAQTEGRPISKSGGPYRDQSGAGMALCIALPLGKTLPPSRDRRGHARRADR
ncbi:hypothetical protein KEM48_009836 [Puccinia striiformis f. sp. tritici PST-130]|nr:hypothetical protein KEM48_009836 [Puccinia striiformis f. sp. tritici PST-130]